MNGVSIRTVTGREHIPKMDMGFRLHSRSEHTNDMSSHDKFTS